jgi:alanyl-tRNA synthetase
VAPDRFRFDFTHFSQPTMEELYEIERIVNERVRQNVPVEIAEMDAEEAFQSGATALFEEKYGERVRVISLGDYSKELCGGTHTRATGDIGLLRIVGETSIAAGVRRIEALTGEKAYDYTQENDRILQAAAGKLKDKPQALPDRLDKLLTRQKTLEKEVDALKAKMATMTPAGGGDEVKKTVGGVSVLIKKVDVEKPAALRDLADKFKQKIGSGVVVLGSEANSKVLLIAVVTDDLSDRFHAGNIVKEVAAVVGGGGGGRPDMAQAGGTKPEKLDEALEKAYSVVEGM